MKKYCSHCGAKFVGNEQKILIDKATKLWKSLNEGESPDNLIEEAINIFTNIPKYFPRFNNPEEIKKLNIRLEIIKNGRSPKEFSSIEMYIKDQLAQKLTVLWNI